MIESDSPYWQKIVSKGKKECREKKNVERRIEEHRSLDRQKEKENMRGERIQFNYDNSLHLPPIPQHIFCQSWPRDSLL